jgi:hypothetical protein
VTDELDALREANRRLEADHRAMQAAFLDLLHRVQWLEAREEPRRFARGVRELRDVPAAALCGREVGR